MTRPALVLGLLAAMACSPPVDRPEGPHSALAEGEALFWRDQYDSARAVFQTALVGARADHDTVGEARALFWLGRAAYGQGDYSAARRDGEEALAVALRGDLEAELFNAWNALGLLAWNQGRLVDAESLLTSASHAAARVSDHLGVGKASGNLGLVKVELGDYAGARAGLEAMLVAGRAAGDTRVEANALANLAMLDIREGDPQSAVPRLHAARGLYARIQYRAGEANLLGQLSTAWQGLGNYQAAFAAADSALVLARQLDLRQEEAANLEVLAVLHRETGNLPAALRRLEQAQVINRNLDLRIETGTDARRVAEIQMELGQFQAAIAGAKEALAIHVSAGAQPERLADLLFLTRADRPNSREWLRQARALADSLRSRRARIDVGLAAAELALADQQWPVAIRELQSSEAGSETLDQILRYQLAAAQATAYRGTRHWPEAQAAAERAVDALERIRGSLAASWSREGFLASRAAAFASLAEILLAQGKVEEAFTVADAARGRGLVEHLSGIAASERSRVPVLAGFAARERTLRRIGDLEHQLAGLDDDTSLESGRTRARLRRQLTELQNEYADAAMQHAGSSGAGALIGGAPVSAAGVQEVLEPEEAVMEYLVGRERVHAFLVTRTAVRHAVLPVTPADLATRIRVARDVAGRAGAPESGWGVLGGLYAILVGPAQSAGWLNGIHRLFIIPHGALTYLPFAALRDLSSGRYLVEDFSLTIAPSAAALVALRDAPMRPSSGPSSLLALAPFPRQLPGTSEEVRAIARQFSHIRALQGNEATENAVVATDSTLRVMHLATHGRLNQDNPLFSRLDLRASSRPGVGGDGRLEVHEILGLMITADLVYLSGCETALGELGNFTGGEGLVTLAQSFLFAGARSVVATLWRIPDAGSAVLVESFYRNLPGRSPTLALAMAQRELIQSQSHASPYYWAGHVVSGDGTVTPIQVR